MFIRSSSAPQKRGGRRQLSLCGLAILAVLTGPQGAAAPSVGPVQCDQYLEVPRVMGPWKLLAKGVTRGKKFDLMEHVQAGLAQRGSPVRVDLIPAPYLWTVRGLAHLPASWGGERFARHREKLEKHLGFVFITGGPELAMLAAHAEKLDRPYDGLGVILGADSLFLMQDAEPHQRELWQLGHETMLPHLSRTNVNRVLAPRLQQVMRNVLMEMAAEKAASGEILINDVASWMSYLSMRAIAEVLFGVEISKAEVETLRPQLNLVWKAGRDSERDARIRAALLALAERAVALAAPAPLVRDLLRVQAEHDLGPEWAKNQILLLIFAGQETTRTAFAAALAMLATHSEWQDRLRGEVEQALTSNDYELFVREVLRLYPPAPYVIREVREDFVLGSYLIPKGYVLAISPLLGKFLPAEWGEHPQEFQPERMLDRPTHRAAFCPFGFGKRTCVGQSLAQAEVKLLLAQVVSQFQIVGVENKHAVFSHKDTGAVLTVSPDFALRFLPRPR